MPGLKTAGFKMSALWPNFNHHPRLINPRLSQRVKKKNMFLSASRARKKNHENSNQQNQHNFALNIWCILKLFLPSMGQLGGPLHQKCEFRGTDHLPFTANPLWLQVDSNLGFFTVSL
jgi:hypothetical protein